MPTLLERLLSPLARAESLRTWPPATVDEHWDEAQDFLRRYQNKRADRLQYAPEFNKTAYGRKIYTPVAVAREVCNFSAEMMFSAEPEITYESNEELLERVEDANGLSGRLVAMAAMVAAQGRGGLRIITDTDVSEDGVPLITHVHEHEVIWDERHGGFVVGGAVVIERQFTNQTGLSADVYRLVEEHVKGGVHRKLYKGTSASLGSSIDMDTIPEFAQLPEEEETGLDVPTLIRWDNVSGGYSDLAGAEAVLDRIDAEVSYGAEKSEKSRPVSFAPAELFDAAGRVDVSGIVALRKGRMTELGEDDLSKRFGTIQPDFLADETIAWIDFLIDTSLLTMGYSKASYGRDSGGGVESGSAIKKRQWRTLIKASGKERMATEALKNALAIVMAWEDSASKVAEYRPEIDLGDPFPRDSLEDAQEVVAWSSAEAISLEEKIKKRRPDWDQDSVDKEVERIEGEAESAQPPTFGERLGAPVAGTLEEPAEEEGNGRLG